ncbi:MAG: hypothetical protein CMM87_00575 [Rickettsiales bacterium]|nr:hypothetical protein [Rickettsiales bacterium]|tara:strand:+ start:73986 stop:74735 length:750 start_codon:yes stop_codon:yes gene_type:complete
MDRDLNSLEVRIDTDAIKEIEETSLREFMDVLEASDRLCKAITEIRSEETERKTRRERQQEYDALCRKASSLGITPVGGFSKIRSEIRRKEAETRRVEECFKRQEEYKDKLKKELAVLRGIPLDEVKYLSIDELKKEIQSIKRRKYQDQRKEKERRKKEKERQKEERYERFGRGSSGFRGSSSSSADAGELSIITARRQFLEDIDRRKRNGQYVSYQENLKARHMYVAQGGHDIGLCRHSDDGSWYYGK